MPYITSLERFGMKKGALQNAREYVLDNLRIRFKRVPQSLTKLIQSIEDEKFLSKLHQEAILVDSLKSFRQLVEKKKS